MRVLFLVSNLTDASSFYRSGGISNNLRRKTGVDIDVVEWSRMPLHWQNLLEYDLVMMQRPGNKADIDLAHYLKDMNMPLWLDYDDDVFNIPPQNKAYLYYDEQKKKETAELIKLANIVTVTTDELKNQYSKYNPNIEVIPNAFNDDIFKRKAWKERTNTALWRGSDTHIYDIWLYGGALNQVIEENPDIKFLFMGFNPWFLKGQPNLVAKKEADLIIFNKDLQSMAPKLVHVPLEDNTFNRCKSNISFIEGTYAGAVCVVPGFWNLPGAVMFDNERGYYEAITAVIKDEVDVKSLNAIAFEFIMDTLSLSKINSLRAEILYRYE